MSTFRTTSQVFDVDKSGENHLLVGSDDFEIRTFRNEDVVNQVTEVDKVTFLKRTNGRNFAYGLANGSIGVYNSPATRAWRVKTKHSVTALASYDIDGDGVRESRLWKLSLRILIFKDNWFV
mgnify:CR=1 FL=1